MTSQKKTKPTRAPWGQHLVLDFNGCPKKLLTDKENILNWSKELVAVSYTHLTLPTIFRV